MPCPLCGTEVSRHFRYSRSTTDEEGQFQLRLVARFALRLDYHVRRGKEAFPRYVDYETLPLGGEDDFDDFLRLASLFPHDMKRIESNSKVKFDESAQTATFEASNGGVVLRYEKAKPFDRVCFEEPKSRKTLFSIPISVFNNELVGALNELQSARNAVRREAYDISTEP